MLYAKFGWPSGSREDEENVKSLQTVGQTRGRTTGDQKSSLELSDQVSLIQNLIQNSVGWLHVSKGYCKRLLIIKITERFTGDLVFLNAGNVCDSSLNTNVNVYKARTGFIITNHEMGRGS